MHADHSETGSDRIVDGIKTVPDPSRSRLNDKQIVDYQNHRRDLLRWCVSIGKDPDKAEGYAQDTVRVRGGHIDRFYRWVWDERDGYTTNITHEDADRYMEFLAYESEKAASTKSKVQKALKMLFRWRDYRFGEGTWEPSVTFSEPNQSNPRDYLSVDERRQLREASLSMGDIPHYNSVEPEDREKWKKYIAVILEKPVDEIEKSDWDSLTGWKETSIIHVSLDTGLRPIEVERARTSWVDLDNGALRIPKEQSSKYRDNWTVALRDQTTDVLERWLAERENYEKYEDTDALWLTRRGNPYSSSSLKGLLHRALEDTDIDPDNRSLTWYSIRHSVGTYMSRSEGLAAAKDQLRHKSIQTTEKYDQTPVEDRRDALDEMG